LAKKTDKDTEMVDEIEAVLLEAFRLFGRVKKRLLDSAKCSECGKGFKDEIKRQVKNGKQIANITIVKSETGNDE
jgi:predicted Zn-ribbon and HTH transcriptional regulator